MLTCVSATDWVILDPFDWKVELRNGSDKYNGGPSTTYTYYAIVIYPENQDCKISFIDLDFFESPETVEHLLIDSKSFEYKGHTWNDVRQGKVTGSIINIPASKLKLPTMSVVNSANGLKQYCAWIGTRNTKYWHSTFVQNFYGIKAMRNQLFYYLYYDPATKIYYFFYMQYYQAVIDGKPHVIGFYGDRYEDPVDLPYYLSTARWYNGSGQRCFKPAAWQQLYDANGGYQSSRITVTPTDSPETLVARFQQLLLQDRAWRLSQHDYNIPSSRYFTVGSHWHRTGSAMHLDLKRVNFDLIFPERERNPNWKAIAGEAYQSLGMADINGVANIKEILEFGETVRSFTETLSKIPSQKVKAVAASWLAVHYGFKLTLLDLKETVEVFEKHALKRSSLSKCQAVENWTADSRRYSARYQVFYDEFANITSYLKRLQSLTDAYLTTENMWDMVPWSFVIDWFVGVGDVLQSLDNYANLMQKHDVICCGRSIKGTTSLRPAQINLPSEFYTGQLLCTYYMRAYQSNLIRPSLVPSVTINPFNHLIEAAALYISIK